MRRFVIAGVLGLLIGAPARGASLLLGTGESLTWNTTTQPTSPTFNVSVQNPGGAVTDPVIAWALGLAIAPEAGAMGTVSFAKFDQPVNYLLASDTSGIMSGVANPPVQLLVNDIATDSGKVVPSTGANLVALTFSATAGAKGTFDIVTYGDATEGSTWVSGNDPNLTPMAFGNVPFPGPNGFPGSPVTLGTLTLIQQGSMVPEPHSALLLLCGCGGALLLHRRISPRAISS
jgi:hypothetical protein